MVSRLAIIFTFALAVTGAVAQEMPQPGQQSVQDQVVAVYVNLNAQLAKQLDTANARIAELQKQLLAAGSKIIELEKKAAPAPK